MKDVNQIRPQLRSLPLSSQSFFSGCESIEKSALCGTEYLENRYVGSIQNLFEGKVLIQVVVFFFLTQNNRLFWNSRTKCLVQVELENPWVQSLP